LQKILIEDFLSIDKSIYTRYLKNVFGMSNHDEFVVSDSRMEENQTRRGINKKIYDPPYNPLKKKKELLLL